MNELASLYFDNAATTSIDERVLEEMLPFLKHNFGNPSSVHSHGRDARAALEKARKKISGLLNVSPGEIIFTSGGTEADNMAICGAIATYNIKHIITSPIEHHAVLHVAEQLAKKQNLKLSLLECDNQGRLNMEQLAMLLENEPNSLVSLMHGNNEIGNLNDIKKIAALCEQHSSYFHSDTVQTMGHYPIDLKTLPIHSLSGSAHKFHGPKGVGFIYINKNKKIDPFIFGGGQERSFRGGTENVAGIIALAKALELAYENQTAHAEEILGIKTYFKNQIIKAIPEVTFNGLSGNLDESLYTVLNVSFPPSESNEGMLLFHLDLNGISVSGGSACSSGAQLGSHVLNALGTNPQRENVRFSFSRFNTKAEVDRVVKTLADLYLP
ncbi:cysteine desulfurase family protein [Cyclobacterium marinum]|uniref:Aminotransferase class V n=1 Tax=Cyclobacterium marinum (strain ATCC 25205 / DSM 745 / LMG 13164 / NCIMB 1802) TaxID=880070 RepID=G0IVU4_CYCMS|nr:cysteine desulfurase family protein [Cyclobacterium marinum]AEL24861.1 aminotransferase class V [Cyclobacterium marinum DSM 745]